MKNVSFYFHILRRNLDGNRLKMNCIQQEVVNNYIYIYIYIYINNTILRTIPVLNTHRHKYT